MIVILKKNPDPKQLESLRNWLTDKGMQIHESVGASQMVLGLVGDTSSLDIDLISAIDIVRNAIVVPWALSVKAHVPDSRK